VRFLTEDTVLVNDYSGVDLDYGGRLRKVLLRHGLRYEVLPYLIERRVRRTVALQRAGPGGRGAELCHLDRLGEHCIPINHNRVGRLVLGQLGGEHGGARSLGEVLATGVGSLATLFRGRPGAAPTGRRRVGSG
jgi:hypothetical protein